MTLSRATFYWLWLILFGVLNASALMGQHIALDSEALWLLTIGVLGVIINSKIIPTTFAKAFDVTIGILFFMVGVIGLLHNFDIDLINRGSTAIGGSVKIGSFLGLSLALESSLIHTLLGFLALSIGVKPKTPPSELLVQSHD